MDVSGKYVTFLHLGFYNSEIIDVNWANWKNVIVLFSNCNIIKTLISQDVTELLKYMRNRVWGGECFTQKIDFPTKIISL